LRELRNVRQKLAAIDNPAFKHVQEDARAQLRTLVPADFPTGVPAVLWQHLPRYLKALARRLDKAPGNQKRDAELMARVRPAMRAFERLTSQQHSDEQHAEIQRLQWLIEELRVSLFAQDLKTAVPVSEKRIQEQIERAQGATLKSMP
jgi:ATP-dependent helicase HrpA